MYINVRTLSLSLFLLTLQRESPTTKRKEKQLMFIEKLITLNRWSYFISKNRIELLIYSTSRRLYNYHI